MRRSMDRRGFLKSALASGGLLAATSAEGVLSQAFAAKTGSGGKKKFEISLAAWSLNRTFRTTWTNLDLPRITREEFGLDGLEFVNGFFDLPNYEYMRELKRRADYHGVNLLLIMVDREGDMSHEDKEERAQAAINHRKWVDIAHYLGCHSIRCNAGYTEVGTVDERVSRAAESFRSLVEYADQAGINVIIENHGGLSSMPDKLISLVKQVGHPRFGTLPDFGNFPPEIDKFEAVKKLMPYAKAVSAKCYDFAPDGTHPAYDLDRMVEIVLAAGYSGYIGIEFEGREMSPHDGVMACKRVLQRHQ
jgi:sugar phosphate isomerase/epimerase